MAQDLNNWKLEYKSSSLLRSSLGSPVQPGQSPQPTAISSMTLLHLVQSFGLVTFSTLSKNSIHIKTLIFYYVWLHLSLKPFQINSAVKRLTLTCVAIFPFSILQRKGKVQPRLTQKPVITVSHVQLPVTLALYQIVESTMLFYPRWLTECQR